MKENYPTFYKFDEFRLDVKGHQLWRDDEAISLTPKAFKMLLILLSRNGELVSKDTLLNEVWSDTFVEESSLTRNISDIRKALAPNKYIHTVPRLGYKFVAEVTEGRDRKPQIYAEKLAAEESSRSDTEVSLQNAPITKEKNNRLAVTSIILLTVFLAAGFSFWIYKGSFSKPTVPDFDREVHSLAILPFKTAKMSKKGETFAFGLVDNLISRLSSLNYFTVRPFSAVEGFSESGKTALEYGRELKVDAVLVGTVQNAGDHFRVSVQLLDLRDGTQLWSSTFDKVESDIFALQDEISAQVATILIKRLTSKDTEKISSDQTESFEAYRAHREGRYFLRQRTSDSMEKSVGFFEKAIKLDDKYLYAYLGLAEAYLLLSDSDYGDVSPKEVKERLEDVLEKAISLNPKSAEVYTVKGFFEMNVNWDIKKSEKHYQQAIAINPNIAKAHHWYAWNLIAQKRLNEAKAKMELAQELDPTSKIIASEMFFPSLYDRDYKSAIALAKKAIAMDDRFLEARINLWYAFYFGGEIDKALKETFLIEKTLKRSGEEDLPHYLATRGLTLVAVGKRREAQDIFKKLIARRKTGEYISPTMLAPFAYEVGEVDKAFSLLEEGFKERSDYLLYVHVAPEFASIRKDQRYEKLKQRIDGE